MGSRITYSPIIKAAQYTLLCSTLLFSTSTLSLRYLYSTSRRGQLDTRIFGLVRMWLHDLRLMYKAPGKWRLMHLKFEVWSTHGHQVWCGKFERWCNWSLMPDPDERPRGTQPSSVPLETSPMRQDSQSHCWKVWLKGPRKWEANLILWCQSVYLTAEPAAVLVAPASAPFIFPSAYFSWRAERFERRIIMLACSLTEKFCLNFMLTKITMHKSRGWAVQTLPAPYFCLLALFVLIYRMTS